MKYIKTSWKYIFFFILFMLISNFFSFTTNDLIWFNTKNINNFLSLSKGYVLSSALTILLMHVKVIRIITYGILSVCIFELLKRTVNKKNNTLSFIAIFIFFLTNTEIITKSYISISSFCTNFISSILVLIIISYLTKDTLYKLNKYIIFILGLVSASFTPLISLLLFITVSIISLYNDIKKTPDKSVNILLGGISLGFIIELILILKSGAVFTLPNIPNNLLYNLIPMLYNVNFLISLLLIAFLLFLSIKIYIKGNRTKRVYVILSIGIIATYSFTNLLSQNIYLNYIMLIFYTIASIFILLNANNSIRFKNKIKTYYLFKIVYLLILVFTPNLNEAHILFPILIDILIILELFNYVFPNNFLKVPWLVISLLILISNIYIYKNIYSRNIELKNYIKHNLECNILKIQIPSKYQNDYMNNYIPKTVKDKENYKNYLGIESDDEYYIEY